MGQWNGGTSNDKFIGSDADDLMDGREGNDTMEGGAGNDYYVIDSLLDVVVEGINQGTDTVITKVTGYTLANNVENLGLANSVAVGTGNALNNTIFGNSANNTLDGGAGNDTLVGGTGNDSYVIDTLADVVSESSAQGTDGVTTLVSGYVLAAHVENLVLGNTVTLGTGNTLDNILTGNAANNSLDGGVGSDTLIGGAGNDSYFVESIGDAVTELISGGIDTVLANLNYTLGANVENLTLTGVLNLTGFGNDLNNVLTSNTGNDSLVGFAGADTLSSGSGTDTLVGGTGNDVYTVNSSTDAVVESAASGVDTVITSVSYTLSNNTENLVLAGTVAAGTGNALNNVITGNGANNTLNGGAGNDTLVGGTGNDNYLVDSLLDVVTETAGQGTDAVTAAVSGCTLAANVENLVLAGTVAAGTGNALNNVITGNGANNTLNGGAGNDTLVGGTGNDNYLVDSLLDVVTETAGQGTDAVTAAVSGCTLAANVENLVLAGTVAAGTGNTLNNSVTGNVANNTLDGGLGDDSLSGMAGNDSLIGGLGSDSLIGGSGNDTYVVDSFADMVIEDINEGTDLIQSSSSWTLSAYIENLSLVGVAAVSATGNEANNYLTGNASHNLLDGRQGSDTLAGGAGNDTYVVDTNTDVVIELSGNGTDWVRSAVSYTLADNVENLALTGSATTAVGNSAANNLVGSAGDNRLDGQSGDDTLSGGFGNDTYIVDSIGDVVVEFNGQGQDRVQSTISYTLPSAIEDLALMGVGSINGTGNDQDNFIIGTVGANLLDGAQGADTLLGGEGNDTYLVDSLADLVIEIDGQGIDEIRTSLSYTLDNSIENLTLMGANDINGTGNSTNNIIKGNDGNNILAGDGGIDTLFGGFGNDTFLLTTSDLDALSSPNQSSAMLINGGSDYNTIIFATAPDQTLDLSNILSNADTGAPTHRIRFIQCIDLSTDNTQSIQISTQDIVGINTFALHSGFGWTSGSYAFEKNLDPSFQLVIKGSANNQIISTSQDQSYQYKGTVYHDNEEYIVLSNYSADANGKFSEKQLIISSNIQHNLKIEQATPSSTIDLGSSSEAVAFTITGNTTSFTLADFNNDGFTDIGTKYTHEDTSPPYTLTSTLHQLYGNPTGLFSSEISINLNENFSSSNGTTTTLTPPTIPEKDTPISSKGDTDADGKAEISTEETIFSAGDFNCDGFDDTVKITGNKCIVTFGNISTDLEISTPLYGHGQGYGIASVSKAGDFDGDGRDDLILSTQDGKNYLIFGKNFEDTPSIDTLQLNSSAMITISDSSYSSYSYLWNAGGIVSSAGDVNGDGYGDLAISSRTDQISYVIFGRQAHSNIDLNTIKTSSTADGFAIHGWYENMYDLYYRGTTITYAGDTNGDGLSDLAICELNQQGHGYYVSPENYTTYQMEYESKGFLIFGKTTTGNLMAHNLSAQEGITINHPQDKHLNSISAGGDINGDGFGDILASTSDSGYQSNGLLPLPSPDTEGNNISYGIFGGNTNTMTNWIFDGNDTIGSTNDDILTGTSDNNQIVGGSGNDTLQGNGGKDVLYGGAGNDSIVITADNIAHFSDTDNESQSIMRIDGGGGIDTLKIDGDGITLDLIPVLAPVIQNIDIIDITGSAGSSPGNTLNLSYIDVLQLGAANTFNSSNEYGTSPVNNNQQLCITGNNGDQVDLRFDDGKWEKDTTNTSGSWNIYNHTGGSNAQLWIDSDITVLI